MACKEFVRGIQLDGVGVAGVGTVVNVASLFVAGALQPINEITVFNDGDKAVKIAYKNDVTGETDSFIVPNGGKAYTHILKIGNIVASTLTAYSLTNVALVGKVVINLAGYRS